MVSFLAAILTLALSPYAPAFAPPHAPPRVTEARPAASRADAAKSRAKSAKEIARAVESHYRHTKTMAAIFLEKYTSGGAGLRAETGTVYFSRPGRMRWDYDAPEKKTFLVDGKNVWYYVPADHTASRSSIKQSDDWRTPLALLAGKMNLERMCGSLSLAPQEETPSQAAASGSAAERGVSNGLHKALPENDPELRPTTPGNSVLVCGPRKEDRNAFSEVLLEVNPQNQLVRITIRQPGDIETEFRFGDWHENIPIEEAKFHFAPPKGVAIVDDSALVNQ